MVEVINGRGMKKIDKHGNNIQYTCLQGDHWRRLRHDQIKLVIYRLLCGLASLWRWRFSTCSLVSILSRDWPESTETGSDSPWFLIFGPLYPGKADRDRDSKTRYKPTMEDRAVDKRAGQLHREYRIRTCGE